MKSSPYKDEVIWIIGASTGIGAALVRILDGQGAKLILTARSVDKLDVLNAQCAQDHMIAPCDVSDVDQIDEIWGSISLKHTKIDRVLFMAAYYDPLSVEENTSEIARKHFDVNVLPVYALIERIIPYFKEKEEGQIALCGSVAGFRGLPNGQPYSSTKAALISLAESMRAELKSSHIDVKLINPGFVETPMTDKNSFKMPMIITADKAAKIIAQGLLSKRFEITFPWLFARIMKTIRILPNVIYFMIFSKK